MNAQTHTLFSQLQAASKHAARIAEQEELKAKQQEYRLSMARAATAQAKKKRADNTMEALLIGLIPVGKENAIDYRRINSSLDGMSIPSSSLSSTLCVLVKKEDIKRIGQKRFYRYYREAA